MRLKTNILILTVLISFSAQAHYQDPRSNCGLSLGSPFSASVDYEEVERSFLTNPRVIYDSPLGQNMDGGEFFASNEHDFHRGEMDRTQVDVLVGFATNSAWDLAVRHRSKILILADRSVRPLVGQEFILRPLFAYANTRAEFINLLAGFPPVPELVKPDLRSLFTVLRSTRHRRAEVDRFRQDLIQRVASNVNFGPAYATTLRSYFTEVDAHFQDSDIQPFFPGPDGWHAGVILFELFHRYDPGAIEFSGPKPARLVDQSGFSFLATEADFLFLRNLFVTGHVHFARTPYDDQTFYQTVAAMTRALNYATIAVSTSNITDCHFEEPRDSNAAYDNVVRATVRTFRTAQLRPPFIFYQTRGLSCPHLFERHVIEDARTPFVTTLPTNSRCRTRGPLPTFPTARPTSDSP